MRVLARDLSAHVGTEVTVAGWLHRRRQLKSVSFAILRDRTGLVQVVLTGPDADQLADLTEETVLQVTGIVTANRQAPDGVEITAPVLTTLSESARPAPFDLYRPNVPAGLSVVLDHAGVALRHPMLRAPFEISAAAVRGFRAHLDGEGFTEIHTPKIVGTVTESGANVFALDYFGRPAYLAQSPQFYKQTMVGVFERVYEVGPVFRAEPHDTARHLAQYTSLDVEVGFITDHHDVMAILTRTLAGTLDTIAHEVPDALDRLRITLPEVPEKIPEIDFVAAQKLLAAHTDEDPRGEPDLAPAHERWLSGWAQREHGSRFLYVTGYPTIKRPFYTHPDPNNPERTRSFDLLFDGLELVTGGQRLHRHSDYLSALSKRGEDPQQYTWYLDTFAHGMPPHGGFAIGLERLTGRITGADNIRSVTLFPRDLHRLTP
jgi:nondiscriminating aspartyl-tRNA synthetase